MAIKATRKKHAKYAFMIITSQTDYYTKELWTIQIHIRKSFLGEPVSWSNIVQTLVQRLYVARNRIHRNGLWCKQMGSSVWMYACARVWVYLWLSEWASEYESYRNNYASESFRETDWSWINLHVIKGINNIHIYSSLSLTFAWSFCTKFLFFCALALALTLEVVHNFADKRTKK